jgi:hypothetical protein
MGRKNECIVFPERLALPENAETCARSWIELGSLKFILEYRMMEPRMDANER